MDSAQEKLDPTEGEGPLNAEDFIQQGADLYDQTLDGDQEVVEVQGRLSEDELHSGLWKKLKAAEEARLQELREKNDGPLNEVDTAEIRGMIKRTKEFLALGEPLVGEEPEGPDLGY